MFKWRRSLIISPLVSIRARRSGGRWTIFTLRRSANQHKEVDMLWTIFVVLVILWLLGFTLHVGGSLIHLLLVVGLVVLVINLLSGRRTAV
jgi:hypothetical protein